jgi:hypothetical protein
MVSVTRLIQGTITHQSAHLKSCNQVNCAKLSLTISSKVVPATLACGGQKSRIVQKIIRGENRFLCGLSVIVTDNATQYRSTTDCALIGNGF